VAVVDDSLMYRVPRTIFLAPHNDDECLWGGFLLQIHRPRVIVVLRSFLQERVGIRYEEREAETTAALYVLGCAYEQWSYRDDDPDWPAIADRVERLANTYDRCFAPAVEDGGHEQHSRVGEIAMRAFGVDRVTRYLTYRRGHGKSTSGCPVEPAAGMVAAKLRALACYETQMRPETGCLPWFMGDVREYVEC
jgi:LmbE family N-acetylglucosaminyl deacetylase